MFQLNRSLFERCFYVEFETIEKQWKCEIARNAKWLNLFLWRSIFDISIKIDLNIYFLKKK